MKILLCLLSDQHVPNLLAVHHFQPERLILIETEQMRNSGTAARFLRALEMGGARYEIGVNAFVERLGHEDSLRDAQTAIKAAYGRFPSDAWIVNVTGGTKPMSIATFEFFRNLGETLVYVNHQRPDVFQWLDGTREEVCSYHPTIAQWLQGYGFDVVKSAEDMRQAEERARQWWDCARLLAKHAGPEELVGWTDDERTKVRKAKSGFELLPAHCGPTLRIAEVQAACQQAFGLTPAEGGLRGPVDKYVARFLSGEWLEAFFWGLLDRHQAALGLWDVRLGLMVAGGRSASASEANEFDVTFLHRHNLNMIECKSGSQTHDKKTEVLYKVEAVMQQFKAIRVRKTLATTSPDVLVADRPELKPELARRAGIYQCLILPYPKIRELAGSADSPEAIARFLELR